MFATPIPFVLIGIDATDCEVEVDVSPRGLQKTVLVGLAQVAVKESVECVRRAIATRATPSRRTGEQFNLNVVELATSPPDRDYQDFGCTAVARFLPFDAGAKQKESAMPVLQEPEILKPADLIKQTGRVPVVLHYQPEGFIRLKEPEDLRRWESRLRESVGLAGYSAEMAGGVCDTITGGKPDACDID